MKLWKFIEILDEPDKIPLKFFRKHGKNVFIDNKLLLALMQEKWSKQTHCKLICLDWIITMDIGASHFGEKRCFEILPIYKNFSDYMSGGCSFFGDKRIPWEEWEDLAKEQVDLLKILVKENKLEQFKDDKRYHDFCDKYQQREEELVKKGYRQLWDGEYT